MKSGWQKKTIGDLCEVIAGQSPEGKFYNIDGKGIPFYQGKKDFGDKFIEAPTTWTTQTTRVAKKGDILMSVRAPVGPVNFATDEVCIGRGLAAIRSSEGLNRDFLYYQLLHLQPEISGREGAVFASINKSEIEALPLAYAPLDEQMRIVSKLDEAFAWLAKAKENAQKNLQNARALFESYLYSKFFELSKNCVEIRLGDVCERVSVGHVGITSPHYRESGILFLRTQNVTKSGLTLEDVKYITDEFNSALKKSAVRSGDVLLSRVITHTVHCALIPENFEKANCANVILVRPGKTLLSKFLIYYIRSSQAQTHLLSHKVGSAQLVVNTTVVKNWPVPIPSCAVQQKIITLLDAFLTEIQRLTNLYKQKTKLLDALKKSILHEAFSGNL